MAYITGEKDRLSSSLQESQKMISENRHENNVLKGKYAALELQYSAEKEAKENVSILYFFGTIFLIYYFLLCSKYLIIVFSTIHCFKI